MTYEQLLKTAYQKARTHQKEEEACKLLMLEISGLEAHQFYLSLKHEIDMQFVEKYLTMLDQYLVHHVPIQHLLGYAYFYGHSFMVNQHVLIPRNETEELVEHILYYYDQHFQHKKINVLDLGTGSGCIGLSLALEEKNMQVTLSDISDQALNVARYNMEKHHLNVKLILSDLFDDMSDSFDIIVSNPPYIPDDEVVEDIVKKEPHIALYGGKLGTEFYEKILKQAKPFLKDKAIIAFEHGYQQKEDIKSYVLKHYPQASILQLKDMQGKDRFTFIGLGGILL